MDSIASLRERWRPISQNIPTSYTQALFTRPTREWEEQISVALREPLQTVRRLLANNRRKNSDCEKRRNSIARPSVVRRYCASFEFPQCDDYSKLLEKDNRSRILAAFHCGDFLFGTAHLLSTNPENRNNFTLSLNKNAAATFANLSAGFGAAAPGVDSELPLSSTHSLQLAALLRARRTSLIVFCDLPPGINQSVEVRFLGRDAKFSVGPAMLALSSRAPLLPIINFSTGDVGQLRLGKQIEPALNAMESLQHAAARITQELVSFFEETLLVYPDQWRFLSLLPLYFSHRQ